MYHRAFRYWQSMALSVAAFLMAFSAQAQPEQSFTANVDAAFGKWVVEPIASVLFFDVWFWDNGSESDAQLPIIVLWLVAGAVFFTLRMNFINVRAFRHALAVTRGHYDDPDDPGEVSHFKALASALSATVGLGNIAGVAVAIGVGGPGATFWMIVAGFVGMTAKFTECTLGQMYRVVDEKGHVLGGPMRYLSVGLSELGRPGLGRALAVLFSILCMGGSFGGGNMFQSNQAYQMISGVVPLFHDQAILFGVLMAFLVGAVIIGGIRRIGSVAGYIVPGMCGVYLMAGVFVLIVNAAHIPEAAAAIVNGAFTPDAGVGGLLGVLVTGFKRAAFSNEAGVGSAAIAHSAAATKEPVREGIVASLGPFIDTIVICTMTALVVVISDAYLGEKDGVRMTSAAFATVIPWFPYVLSFAVFFFAFSTMISWSYYGERCCVYVFGPGGSMPYKIVYLLFAFLGPLVSLENVITFSDLMILGMALPNVLGVVLLSGKVRAALDEYWARYLSGQMPLRDFPNRPARKHG